MKTKNILHLVTFVLTFAVSVTVAGAVKSFIGLSTAEKITNVLTEDISNGVSSRTNYGTNKVSIAYRTNGYVSASESINVDGLPTDFQEAWQQHMQAWRIHANYLDAKKHSVGFNYNYDELSEEQIEVINRTWFRVLQIARQHGAKIPANAYN